MTLTYNGYELTGTVDECIEFIKNTEPTIVWTGATDINRLVNTDPMIELNKNNITVVREDKKKRLTNKITEEEYEKHKLPKEFKYHISNSTSAIRKAIRKLGELEDIEEGYKIDILEAVNLCKKVNEQKVVYVKENWGIDTIDLTDDLDVEIFNHRLYSNARGVYVSLDLLEYNKTWSLKKEDLK